MGCPGLEPGTNRLKAEYSTIELATLAFGVNLSLPRLDKSTQTAIDL
jgi:hypothetical protein